MGSRPRDNQRKRLYTAENAIKLDDPGKKFDTVEEVENYINDIINTEWFLNRFPAVGAVEVNDGRGRKHAGGQRHIWSSAKPWQRKHRDWLPSDDATHVVGEVWLPRWARTEFVILHELAHVCTPLDREAHGRYFAKVLLKLVKRFMGRDKAAILRDSYREHGVKWYLPKDEQPPTFK